MPKSEKEVFGDKIRFAAMLPCILCRRAPACGSAMWIPGNEHDKRLVGTPHNKLRTLVYPLCEHCGQTPHAFERIEEIIRAAICLKN